MEADGVTQVWSVDITVGPGETQTLYIDEVEAGKGGRFAYSTKYMLRQ